MIYFVCCNIEIFQFKDLFVTFANLERIRNLWKISIVLSTMYILCLGFVEYVIFSLALTIVSKPSHLSSRWECKTTHGNSALHTCFSLWYENYKVGRLKQRSLQSIPTLCFWTPSDTHYFVSCPKLF